MKSIRVISSHRAAALALILLPAATLSAASLKGVPNFQVVNEGVYRGGQPSDEGFRNLAAMGIKTVVDLRREDDDRKAEEKAVSALGMRYINIPMRGMTTPTEAQISSALKALNQSDDAPVFVHCMRGKDRTGVVVAAYRIQHDGWENRRALKEARNLGMSWFQFPLQRYVMGYKVDRESERGIAATSGEVQESAGAIDAAK